VSLIILNENSVSFSGLPWYFSLAEEAFKSWDHCCTDNLVYFGQMADCDHGAFSSVSEFNIDGDRWHWIEAHLWFGGKRKSHYVAIVDGFSLGFWNDAGHVDSGNPGNRPNMPVLDDVPQVVQFPKRTNVIGAQVSVRLQRFDYDNCLIGDAVGQLCDSQLCFERILLKYRETDFTGGLIYRKFCQLPSEIIERRSQTRNEVSSNQSGIESGFREREFNDVLASFKIIIGRYAIGIQLTGQKPDMFIERVEMFLRPTHLFVCVHKARHEAIVAETVRDIKG